MNAKPKVVSVRQKPQEQIVVQLEDYLARARDGKLVGIAIVALYAPSEGGGARMSWHRAGGGYYELLGAVEDMKLDLMMSVREFKQIT